MVRLRTVLSFYWVLRRKEISCRDDLCRMLEFQLHADVVRKYLERRLARIKQMNRREP